MVIFILIYSRVLENAQINIHVTAKKKKIRCKFSERPNLHRACASGGPEHTQ